MKMTKTILAIAVIMAVLLSTLCGCGKTSDDEINVEQSNEEEIDIAEPIEGEEYETVKGESAVNHATFIPLSIQMRKGVSFKERFIKQIEISKTISEEDKDYWLYEEHKISDIQEFYSLDNLKIYGYELYNVNITEGAFNFQFVPFQEWNNEYIFDIGVIWMSIDRLDWVYQSDPLKSIIEDADIQGRNYLYDGDILYYPERGDAYAKIVDTLFYIRVPQELNSYEYLRDLAFNVIETAELVVVGE